MASFWCQCTCSFNTMGIGKAKMTKSMIKSVIHEASHIGRTSIQSLPWNSLTRAVIGLQAKRLLKKKEIVHAPTITSTMSAHILNFRIEKMLLKKTRTDALVKPRPIVASICRANLHWNNEPGYRQLMEAYPLEDEEAWLLEDRLSVCSNNLMLSKSSINGSYKL